LLFSGVRKSELAHAGPTLGTATRPSHVGLCPRFVDENDALRIDVVLVIFAVPMFLSNVFAFLFGGKSVSFLSSQSQSSTSFTECHRRHHALPAPRAEILAGKSRVAPCWCSAYSNCQAGATLSDATL